MTAEQIHVLITCGSSSRSVDRTGEQIVHRPPKIYLFSIFPTSMEYAFSESNTIDSDILTFIAGTLVLPRVTINNKYDPFPFDL